MCKVVKFLTSRFAIFWCGMEGQISVSSSIFTVGLVTYSCFSLPPSDAFLTTMKSVAETIIDMSKEIEIDQIQHAKGCKSCDWWESTKRKKKSYI